jgi:chemotaxis protein histidine kinase CheA
MDDMLNDPDMRDLVLDFCDESVAFLQELEETLEVLEDDVTATENLEKFGQIIDRIMGAAKSIGANDIATFCELGKVIGYKSSQVEDKALLEVVVAILFDTVYLLNKMFKDLQDNKTTEMKNLSSKGFVSRLNWLSDKFKNIKRASVGFAGEDENLEQASIDDLMASLGL